MPAKAVSRLVSPGLAPDTDEILAIMESKFPPPPPSQHLSRRPQPPPANELTEESVVRAILSFARGAGAGPSGTRPDFLRQL
eukprot:9441436-Karenia_brevis.AAC.1